MLAESRNPHRGKFRLAGSWREKGSARPGGYSHVASNCFPLLFEPRIAGSVFQHFRGTGDPTMTSRLSELAGCEATAEEFFPASIAGNPRESAGWEAVLGEPTPADLDSSLGAQLTCLLQEVESATVHAKRLVSGRSEEELTTRVRPDSWSAAECLEHLALTTWAFLPPIAETIAKAPKLTRNRALRADMLARVLIRTLEPPYRLRHKVLGHLAPRRNDFAPTWMGFLKSQEQLAQMIRSTVGLAIDRVKVQSPVCSRVSYNVYGALGVLSAHQRRHLWQVEQILQALDRRSA